MKRSPGAFQIVITDSGSQIVTMSLWLEIWQDITNSVPTAEPDSNHPSSDVTRKKRLSIFYKRPGTPDLIGNTTEKPESHHLTSEKMAECTILVLKIRHGPI